VTSVPDVRVRPQADHEHHRFVFLGWLVLIAVFAVTVACSHAKPAKEAMPSARNGSEATLSPGDVVDLKFFYVPELNDSQTIRPDGKLSLQLVGEVQAAGQTPEELRQKLFELYTPQLKKPDVSVIVRSFQGRRVYVGGEVNVPGTIQMPGPMSALEAIMQSGGFNPRSAAIRKVVVIRHKDGRRFGALLDFRDAMKGREFEDFNLEPLDIVFVPRKNIVKVNTWIDQHINKLIPYLGIAYSFPVNGNTMTLDTTRRFNAQE
jgi:protein involved in polysaccharide export with SLBB domain